MNKQSAENWREHLRKTIDEIDPRRFSENPMERDGWATFIRWETEGSQTVRPTEPLTLNPDDDLSTSQLRHGVSGLRITWREKNAPWIILARHNAAEPIPRPKSQPFGFPDPMITWVCMGGIEPNSPISAGCLNLERAPTYGDVFEQLSPGQYHRADGNKNWLDIDDIDFETELLLRGLPHFLKPRTTG